MYPATAAPNTNTSSMFHPEKKNKRCNRFRPRDTFFFGAMDYSFSMVRICFCPGCCNERCVQVDSDYTPPYCFYPPPPSVCVSPPSDSYSPPPPLKPRSAISKLYGHFVQIIDSGHKDWGRVGRMMPAGNGYVAVDLCGSKNQNRILARFAQVSILSPPDEFIGSISRPVLIVFV